MSRVCYSAASGESLGQKALRQEQLGVFIAPGFILSTAIGFGHNFVAYTKHAGSKWLKSLLV